MEAIALGTTVYNQQNPGSFLENQNPILTGSSLQYLPHLGGKDGNAPYPSPRANSGEPLIRNSIDE
jgi:hypothetical protein